MGRRFRGRAAPPGELMRQMLVGLASFSLAALVACSSSSDSPAGNPGTDGGTDGGGDGGSDFKHDVVLSMSLTVPAGGELHQCQFVQVPPVAGGDLNVVRFAHQYTPGSHHFLIYQTDLTSIPSDLTGQYDCTQGDEPVMVHSRGIMYAAQSAKGDFPLPTGVGVKITAGSVLMFQTHYINASKKDLPARVDLGLDVAPAETIKQNAGFLIFYDPFIDLPVHGKASSGIRCDVPGDINLINAFTHYHQRGTGMKVYVDSSKTTPSDTPFFQTNDWEHPADYVGPTTIKGGSVVRFQCDYDNTTGADEIFQGPNAQTSEMCVFAGLYYPAVPADSSWKNCRRPSIIGTGTKACIDVGTCIQSCPASDFPVETWSGARVGPCFERCVASGCDGAFDALLPLQTCGAKNCSAECGAGKCTECLASKCSAELGSCSSQTCK
jgi:hypothetical protein